MTEMENSSHETGNERVSVDLTDLFRTLWKKKAVILITTLVFAAAAFAVCKKLETISYISSTSILILDKEDIDSCVQIVKSEYVLKKAAERLSRNFDVDVAGLKNSVSASRINETRMIEISASAPVPDEAEQTARTVRDFAIDRIKELLDSPEEHLTDVNDAKPEMLKDSKLVEIIDDAGAAGLTSNVSIKKNVLLFALLGFILAAGFLGVKYLLHELTCPIKRPEDITRFLGEEVLTVLPEGKERAKKIIKIYEKENSLCVPAGENDAAGREAIRFLRTNLTALSGAGKVFCFAGTFGGDGTLSVAFYTAKAFADAGKKVLYIDADIRKAAAGGKIDFPGLCELMNSEAAFDEVVLKTEYDELYVMPVGDISKASGEIFDKAYFKIMLADCRKKYDYVILNTPPARSYADPAIIGKECDGTVYVIRSGEVSCMLARTLLEQMKKAGCRVMGTVLTGADMKNDSYYGKYYYSYR